tara:strand:+ start:11865 stop:13154 length:1290 start_codon:yes stop_codon:yes gene_type:complete
MRNKNHHLAQRKSRWYLRIRYPKKVRVILGLQPDAEYEVTLETGDVREARKARDARLVIIRKEWDRICSEAGSDESSLIKQALELKKRTEGNPAAIEFDRNVQVDIWRDKIRDRAFALGLIDKYGAGEMDIDVAEDIAASMDPEAKKYENAILVAIGESVPISEASERFLGVCDLSKSTIANYRTAYKVLLSEYSYFNELDKPSVRDLFNKLGQSLTKATLHKYRSAYRQLWEFENLPSDIWEQKIYSRVKGTKRNRFADEDYGRLLIECQHSNPQLFHAIRIAAHTGGRLAEVTNCSLVEVVEGTYFIILPGTKNEQSNREIPCHSAIVDSVKVWCANPLSTKDLGRDFTALKKKLGYSDEHVFHSFRHSFTHKLEMAEIPLNIAKKLLGHKLADVTFGLYGGRLGANEKIAIRAIESIRWQGDIVRI